MLNDAINVTPNSRCLTNYSREPTCILQYTANALLSNPDEILHFLVQGLIDNRADVIAAWDRFEVDRLGARGGRVDIIRRVVRRCVKEMQSMMMDARRG